MANPPTSSTVYIIGPSSTGKTTLCKALSKRLGVSGPAVITEVARDVMRRTGFSRATVGQLAMQKAILEAQVDRQDAVRDLPGVKLSDRSGIDPIVYAMLTAASGEEALERRQALVSTPPFQRALPEYRAALVLLLKPVPEWVVDDGVRSLDDQVECLEVFRRVLFDLQIPFEEMGLEVLDIEERVDIVLGYMKAIDERFKVSVGHKASQLSCSPAH